MKRRLATSSRDPHPSRWLIYDPAPRLAVPKMLVPHLPSREHCSWRRQYGRVEYWKLLYLGSGLIDQSQNMNVAAMQMADMKV